MGLGKDPPSQLYPKLSVVIAHCWDRSSTLNSFRQLGGSSKFLPESFVLKNNQPKETNFGAANSVPLQVFAKFTKCCLWIMFTNFALTCKGGLFHIKIKSGYCTSLISLSL